MKKIKPIHYLLVFIGIIFLVNSQYIAYPDEFVNILGGKFILEGKIPYKDFFDHHLPGAWYMSALILLFSFGSFVKFRLIWGGLQYLILFLVGRFVQKKSKELFPFYAGYFLLYPFVTMYYWTHLFIADGIAFLFFSALFWMLFTESYQKETKLKTVIFFSLANFIFVFSSLTYIYIALLFYTWIVVLLFKSKPKWGEIVRFCLISAVPYLIYGLYLLLSNSWKEFYISNFVYNTTLYIDIPNYKMGHFFNPFKFALTIIYNFFNTYIQLLVRIKEFNLYFPVDLVLALSTFLLLVVLLKELPLIGVLYFFVLSFSAPRSNLMKIGETDYQSGLFIALGAISFFLLLWRYKYIKFTFEPLEFIKKFLVAMVVLYGVFASIFLIENTYNKFYLRYTQKMPSIYDHAPTAFFINEVLQKDDYYWIGPYEPNEEFFVKGAKLPGKFPTLLPQFRESAYFSGEFIKQFESHTPKLIIYKHEASIFGTPALEFGKFFTDWMEGKYISLEHIKGLEALKSPETFNMRTDVYLLKSEKDTILKRLAETGYIKY
ncbi:MAG: hypothetical protein NTV98_01520 [Candidatus Roizmanbacteria bacterium]|nr:hypothetical protein [Candidatus Roizmanbacteria bacterium]